MSREPERSLSAERNASRKDENRCSILHVSSALMSIFSLAEVVAGIILSPICPTGEKLRFDFGDLLFRELFPTAASMLLLDSRGGLSGFDTGIRSELYTSLRFAIMSPVLSRP